MLDFTGTFQGLSTKIDEVSLKVNEMDNKTDDLENRSHRNNLCFNKTPAQVFTPPAKKKHGGTGLEIFGGQI